MFDMQIPKKLHLIWIGDEAKKPTACIDSWQRNHPDWVFRLWGNDDLYSANWINKTHIEKLVREKRWPGVADLMRYEIIYKEGGVYADADSFSLRPLDDWLLENEMFACWEDTLSRARLVNNAFLGSIPQNPFLKFVIETIRRKTQLDIRWSWSRMRFVKVGVWRSVGPYHLTRCIHRYNKTGYNNISILPSHMFSPTHFRGNAYGGNGVVFADHQWGTTKKLYSSGVLENPVEDAALNSNDNVGSQRTQVLAAI
jgi:mannosyltransferase OCH1-like enzyme